MANNSVTTAGSERAGAAALRLSANDSARAWLEEAGMPSIKTELLTATNSLYDDQVCPTVGVLRRRVLDRTGRALDHVELELLILSAGFQLTGKPSNKTVVLPGRAQAFVDPNDTQDPYPPEVWAHLENLTAERHAASLGWAGGRFGCATELCEGYPEVYGRYTLGQVQHLVQLAIRRNLLGYAGGAIMPYCLSKAVLGKEFAATTPSPLVAAWPGRRADAQVNALTPFAKKAKASKTGVLITEGFFAGWCRRKSKRAGRFFYISPCGAMTVWEEDAEAAAETMQVIQDKALREGADLDAARREAAERCQLVLATTGRSPLSTGETALEAAVDAAWEPYAAALEARDPPSRSKAMAAVPPPPFPCEPPASARRGSRGGAKNTKATARPTLEQPQPRKHAVENSGKTKLYDELRAGARSAPLPETIGMRGAMTMAALREAERSQRGPARNAQPVASRRTVTVAWPQAAMAPLARGASGPYQLAVPKARGATADALAATPPARTTKKERQLARRGGRRALAILEQAAREDAKATEPRERRNSSEEPEEEPTPPLPAAPGFEAPGVKIEVKGTFLHVVHMESGQRLTVSLPKNFGASDRTEATSVAARYHRSCSINA